MWIWLRTTRKMCMWCLYQRRKRKLRSTLPPLPELLFKILGCKFFNPSHGVFFFHCTKTKRENYVSCRNVCCLVFYCWIIQSWNGVGAESVARGIQSLWSPLLDCPFYLLKQEKETKKEKEKGKRKKEKGKRKKEKGKNKQYQTTFAVTKG